MFVSQMFFFVVSCCVLSIINPTLALEPFVHPDCVNSTICTLPPPGSDEATVPVYRQRNGTSMCYSGCSFNFQGDVYTTRGNMDNCYTKSWSERVFAIRINNAWRKVKQTKYFEQTVTRTECHSALNTGHCMEALGKSSTCVEVYGVVVLNVYEKDKLVAHDFPVPVGCRCQINQISYD